jgi:protein TonB
LLQHPAKPIIQNVYVKANGCAKTSTRLAHLEIEFGAVEDSPGRSFITGARKLQPLSGQIALMLHFEFSQRISLPLWTLSALVAVTMHCACFALLYEYMLDDDPEPEFGAPAIEFSIELLAPRLEPIDLPPGPDIEQSVASLPVVEQAKLQPAALPREVPTETEVPELVATPVEIKKLTEEQPKIATIHTIPQVEMTAAEATARPSSEIIQESTRSVTPAQGTGESPQRVLATWQKELIAHFDRHKRYPASHSLDSADILVNFVLDETGRVLSSSIVRGSGDPFFDEAALVMIRRSDPVPKPPALVVQAGLSFILPVIFRIKHVN